MSQNTEALLLNKKSDFSLMGGWDLTWIQRVKGSLGNNESLYIAAYDKIIQKADQALKDGEYSVTFKKLVPPSGNKHDYMSMGPYWWPDPDKHDGLPYIRQDGEVNPERNELDSNPKSKMINAVRSLSLAWYFSEKEIYSNKAADLLRVWFLDSSTFMNPHLEYAQSIPGRTPGRYIGLIDMKSLHELVDAIALLERSDALTQMERKKIHDWFRKYLRWLKESGHGKKEDAYRNNHSVAYDVQSMGIAIFTGDLQYAGWKAREIPRRRIDPMIEGDGRQPHELIRTKAYGYSISNLGNFMDAGVKGMKLGVNIFHYKNVKGGSIKNALDYLIAFIDKKKEWPFAQIEDWEIKEDQLGLLIRRAAWIFKDKSYQDLWEDRFQKELGNHWNVLVFPDYSR